MLTFLSGGDEGQEVKIAIQALGEVTSYGVHEKTERIFRKRWLSNGGKATRRKSWMIMVLNDVTTTWQLFETCLEFGLEANK